MRPQSRLPASRTRAEVPAAATGEPSGPQLRTPAKVALAVFLGLLGNSGCLEPDSTVRVASHLADVVHEREPDTLATHAYPQIALSGQTRTVLASPTTQNPPLLWLHESVDIEVGEGAQLEVACAIRPNPFRDGSVRFSVTASQDGKALDVLTESLPVTAHSEGWQEFTVDLSAFEGALSLDFITEFNSEGDSQAGGSPTLGLFSAPVLLAEKPRRRPNIILVSLDTLRAFSLATYGYDRDTAPFLTEFFTEKGQIVDRAYSPAADTLYGHTAMLYGIEAPAILQQLSEHHVQHVAGAAPMADVLRDAGYRTAAFTENANVAADWGFARGFEIYDEEKSVGDEPGEGSFIRQTFDRGIDWIESHKDQQLFVFLQTYEVHNPYEPPASVADLFPTPPGSDAPRVDLDLYDREIRYTDSEMRRLIGKLEEFGILEHSILVVTSDHGEEFGEHGGRYHNARLYEEILRIPFFIHAPGVLPEGTRRDGPVALQDLYPTLCELLELSCPADLDGRSVAEHLKTGAALAPRELVAEARGNLRFTYEGLDSGWTPPGNALIDHPWKLHRYTVQGEPSYELYNLDEDPQERTNRYGEPGTPSARLRERIDGYEARVHERLTAMIAKYGKGDEAPQPAASPADSARNEKLRALGYIE